jgi:hypothetical protein
MYVSMALTIVLSTDMQNRHDYNAFQLANVTAQCELMDISHYHEKSISSFLQLCSLVWCKGSLCRGVYRVHGSLESQAPDSIWSPVYAED